MLHRSARLTFLHRERLDFLVDSLSLYNFIGHKRVRPRGHSKTLATNPSDGSTLTEILSSSDADCLDAMFAAESAARVVFSQPTASRCSMLRSLSSRLTKAAAFLGLTESVSTGLRITDAKRSIQFAAEALESIACASESERSVRNSKPGVTVILCDAPLPLENVIVRFGLEVAGGNAVVVKPSDKYSPLSLLAAADILLQCEEFPPGAFNIVLGGPGFGLSSLINHATSLHVTDAAAHCDSIVEKHGAGSCGEIDVRVQRCGPSVELILPTQNIEKAAQQAALNCFVRRCMANVFDRFVLVHEDNFFHFVQNVADVARKLKTGHAMDASIDYGPVESPTTVQDVLDDIQHCTTHHRCHILLGGFKTAFSGNILPPTILLFGPNQVFPSNAVTPIKDSNVPLMCVKPYKAIAEAVGYANTLPFRHSLTIIGSSAAEEASCAANLNARKLMYSNVLCGETAANADGNALRKVRRIQWDD